MPHDHSFSNGSFHHEPGVELLDPEWVNAAKQALPTLVDVFGHHYADEHCTSEHDSEVVIDFAHNLMEVMQNADVKVGRKRGEPNHL